MKRLAVALAAACACAFALAGVASANQIEVGATTTAVAAPTCPTEATTEEAESDCQIVLAKTTSYEQLSDGKSNPDLVSQPGLIDAFTLGIAGLYIPGATLASIEQTLNSNWGGAPSVQLTVLRPVPSRAGKHWEVAAQSPAIALDAYITGTQAGSVTEFPLTNPIPVVKGEMLAITVPTWAPILSIGLGANQFSYIQSHSAQLSTAANASKTPSCTNITAPTRAQLTLGEQALYSCSYKGTRLEYSALEVTAASVSSARRHKRALASAKRVAEAVKHATARGHRD